jgi:hypothetical protein
MLSPHLRKFGHRSACSTAAADSTTADGTLADFGRCSCSPSTAGACSGVLSAAIIVTATIFIAVFDAAGTGSISVRAAGDHWGQWDVYDRR